MDLELKLRSVLDAAMYHGYTMRMDIPPVEFPRILAAVVRSGEFSELYVTSESVRAGKTNWYIGTRFSLWTEKPVITPLGDFEINDSLLCECELSKHFFVSFVAGWLFRNTTNVEHYVCPSSESSTRILKVNDDVDYQH
tara:strand:- start:154 stop:570 length:417 start_codon:yes stop_codon:yes gene_type:complete